MPNKHIELTQKEELIIIFLREAGSYADFSVEKRPSIDHPQGEITRIVKSESVILGNLLKGVE